MRILRPCDFSVSPPLCLPVTSSFVLPGLMLACVWAEIVIHAALAVCVPVFFMLFRLQCRVSLWSATVFVPHVTALAPSHLTLQLHDQQRLGRREKCPHPPPPSHRPPSPRQRLSAATAESAWHLLRPARVPQPRFPSLLPSLSPLSRECARGGATVGSARGIRKLLLGCIYMYIIFPVHIARILSQSAHALGT